MPGSLDATIDVHCVTDFLARMPEVSGIVALMHRLARRLSMPRGIWPWAPDDGTDMRQFLLSKVPSRQIVRAAILECEKDEQVESVEAAIIARTDRVIQLRLTVTPVDGDAFTFTMTITEALASVDLLAA